MTETDAVLDVPPDVIDAAVPPVPPPTLGEEPDAVVPLAAGSQARPEDIRPEAIRAFAAARLVAGKIQRASVRRVFAEPA